MPSKKRTIDDVSSDGSSRGNFVDVADLPFLDDSPEFAKYYGPGNFHPVHLGDLFNRSRYKILRKLGTGSFSTVWLAKDRSMNRYVALKIPSADAKVSENETKIHEYLSQQKFQHPGQKHVTTLLDSFEHQGPNGTHRCLVFDVMGPNANHMVQKIPKPLRPIPPERELSYTMHRYPFWLAKSMLRQILQGIDYLHKCDIVHGDLQPGNVLFSVHDLSSLPEKYLAQPEVRPKIFEKTVNRRGEVKFRDPEVHHGRRGYYAQRQINGKPDPCYPRYIVSKEPMFEDVDFYRPPHVKISDLGGAVLKSQGKPVTPLGLRSPEMILGEPIGPSQDIWSFGCLLFEFLTSTMLFTVWSPHMFGEIKVFKKDDENNKPLQEPFVDAAATNNGDHITGKGDKEHSHKAQSDSKNHASPGCEQKQNPTVRTHQDRWANTNDGHILDIARLFGPVPPSFMARFPRSKTYFNEKGEIIKDFVGEAPSDDESDDGHQQPIQHTSISAYLDHEKGTDLSSKDAQIVKKLLYSILQIEPADRPTAEELLAHPWFADPKSPKQKLPHEHDRQDTSHQNHRRGQRGGGRRGLAGHGNRQ